jgi:hypothetical protein
VARVRHHNPQPHPSPNGGSLLTMLISGFYAYTLTRFSCVKCGQFEHGWQVNCITRCPFCRGYILKDSECKGMTVRMLPFTTSPRVEAKPKLEKQDPSMGIPEGVGEFKPRGAGYQANGKSTGRPRGGNGRGATNYRGEAHSKYRYEGKFQPKDEDDQE